MWTSCCSTTENIIQPTVEPVGSSVKLRFLLSTLSPGYIHNDLLQLTFTSELSRAGDLHDGRDRVHGLMAQTGSELLLLFQAHRASVGSVSVRVWWLNCISILPLRMCVLVHAARKTHRNDSLLGLSGLQQWCYWWGKKDKKRPAAEPDRSAVILITISVIHWHKRSRKMGLTSGSLHF